MRTRLPLLLSTLGTTALVTLSGTALRAQVQSGEFSVQRFEPAAGANNYLSVEGARMDAQWGWTAALMFNYSRNPFVLVTCQSESNCSSGAPGRTNVGVVKDMFTWDVMASLNPLKFLQIGLRLPLSYVSGDGIDVTTGGPAVGGLRAFGVGDPDIEAKLRFLGGPKDPIVAGAAVDASFPVGHATASGDYIGNSSPITVGVRGILDGKAGPLSFGLNLKGVYRQAATLGTTEIGSEFRYGAGLGYRLSPVFRVLAEGYGGTKFSSKAGTNSLEVDGAIQIQPLSSPLVFTIGGGPGVLEGVGVPDARAFVGIAFVAESGDQDADGIKDNDDKCVTIPEDKDNFQDADGCPDLDNDGDGIPDKKDKCPNQPETINGYQDDDGCPDEIPDRDKDGIADSEDKCPDEGGKSVIKTKGPYYGCPDRDGDGVPDKIDKCPDQPEDTDGFQDEDGCPDPDNDNDGIPDDHDECINEPEVYNQYKDEDGCPDEAPDRDKDGIPDSKDKCPTVPENFNGYEDEDGCPDKGPALVQVTENGITILQRVEFGTGSDKIAGVVSFKVLDAVAGVLKTHGDIFLVEIAGHTDNIGPADANRTLSQKRSEAVVKYLVGKGIVANRLEAKGYGPDKPLGDNKTGAGRQKNRRVEFNILRSEKKDAANPNGPPPIAPPAGATASPAPAPAAPAAPTPPKPGAPAPAVPAAPAAPKKVTPPSTL